MSRKTLSIFIIFFSALFAFQTLEIAVIRSNPKTCCGRVICLCKHGPAPCDFKNKPVQKTAPEHGVSMPCHRHEAVKKIEIPQGAVSFSKAPCAKDTPKTLLPQVFKDYLSSSRGGEVELSFNESGVIQALPEFIPLSFSSSIEYPPRTV